MSPILGFFLICMLLLGWLCHLMSIYAHRFWALFIGMSFPGWAGVFLIFVRPVECFTEGGQAEHTNGRGRGGEHVWKRRTSLYHMMYHFPFKRYLHLIYKFNLFTINCLLLMWGFNKFAIPIPVTDLPYFIFARYPFLYPIYMCQKCMKWNTFWGVLYSQNTLQK